MTFNVSDAERLAVVRSAVAKFAVDIMAPVVVSTETGTVEVVATLKGCREHVRTKEFLWRSSTAPPTVAAKDAEIAKLRETVEAQRLNIGELEGASVQWMTETKRLRSQILAEQEHARQAQAESAGYANKIDRLRADLARLRAIEAAAVAFLPAHDQATFDMKPVYGCAFAHGVQFVGKGYGDELEALRAALDAAQGGG